MGKKWGNKVWGKCEKPKSVKNVKNSRGKILEKNWRWKNVDKWLGGGEKRGKMSVWKKAWQISEEKYYISSCASDCCSSYTWSWSSHPGNDEHRRISCKWFRRIWYTPAAAASFASPWSYSWSATQGSSFTQFSWIHDLWLLGRSVHGHAPLRLISPHWVIHEHAAFTSS